MGIFQRICVTFTPLASHFSIGLSYQSKCYTSPPWVQHSPPLEPYSTIGWANMGITNPTCNCHVYHLSSSDTTCYESRSFDFNFRDLGLWELMINTLWKVSLCDITYKCWHTTVWYIYPRLLLFWFRQVVELVRSGRLKSSLSGYY